MTERGAGVVWTLCQNLERVRLWLARQRRSLSLRCRADVCSCRSEPPISLEEGGVIWWKG